MKTNHASKTTETKRPYRQGARAEAAARNAEAVIDAFRTFLNTDWYNDISLERLAAAANVTVPTILRRFGNKEGILEALTARFEQEILMRRTVAPGDIDAAIAVLVADYEVAGDMILRLLAQEDRIPAIRNITDFGRGRHRDWVRSTFATHLEGLPPDVAEWRLDGLTTALDIHIWKLLRRERGRSPEDVRAYMTSLVCAIIGPSDRAT